MMFRVNQIVDIKPQKGKEQKKLNTVPADKYVYGMQKNLKKRKYNDFFAERKAFQEDGDVTKEFKKIKLNPDSEQTNSQSTIETGFFD